MNKKRLYFDMDGIVRLKWINHEMFFSVFVNMLTIS